jgi:hypothetical protein
MKALIIPTPDFTHQANKLIAKRKLLAEDLANLKKELTQYPELGDLVPGTGGIRKIRLKSSSKGKSGGFRLCYFYYSHKYELYLIMIYAKNEQENLSADQKQNLKKIIELIKEKDHAKEKKR